MIIKSKKKVLNKRVRLPINWLAVIASKRLDRSFYIYRMKHNSISLERCARSFVLKNKLVYDKRLFLKGTSRDDLNNFLVNRLIDFLNDKDEDLFVDPLSCLYSREFVF